jgi:3-methyladenine DNA glycosylase AlkC
MAEPLKHLLNEEAVRWLADSLGTVSPAFDRAAFASAAMLGLADMELKQRAQHIAKVMGQFLPPHFPDAAAIVGKSLGPVVEATGENGLSVLRYFAHDSFIEQFGLKHPEESFALMAEVTRRASCEFSVRAFYLRHPEKTHKQMQLWAKSGDAHHRRLASEGSRPRLPWGQRLHGFVADPAPVIAILELLKDDPVRYVQRSVANSINDITKDHPDIAVTLCESWNDAASEGRTWIVRHALRDLVKKGNIRALRLLGGGAKPRIEISGVVMNPCRLEVGGKLNFTATLHSTARTAQDLIVDFVIDYRKANGGLKPKVFKLAKLKLGKGETTLLSSSVSFADMTTRRHFPGKHVLALQINGERRELAEFALHAKRHSKRRRQPAINSQHMAVDIGGSIGRKEHDRAADFLRLRPAARRRARLDP